MQHKLQQMEEGAEECPVS